jgi:cytochrome c2
MRISPTLCGSAALAIVLGIAMSTTSVQAKHMTAPASGLVAKGKALISAKRCNGCHGADLNGKPHFSPSLHASKRPMTEYNKGTFVRLLTTGVDNDGKKIGPPMSMACNQKPADAAAMYAYLKTVK